MRNDLILDYIDLSGFMSFPPNKNYRIQLNTNKLTTIIGENLDGGDGERNGVGKSAIIDAILYLLFGRSPRVSNQGFINYVYPGSMSVSGSGSRNGISFYIERGENPSFLRIFEKPIKDIRDFRHKEDGKFIFDCTKSTKPETNKRIIELIGFDIKLADVLIASNPSDKACFFLKTEEEQRNIIERIFGFTIFTEKAELLREMRKEETRNLSNKESIFIATKQANDRVIDEIKQLEQKSIEWIAERDHQINLWNQKINYYDNVDFTNEIKILTEINREF
jgi:DNA repair exonuclease SbcCD ATPase subunit